MGDRKYSVIDLFAGCGGLSLGLEQAGFTTIFANDINKVCANTYKHNIGLGKDRFYVGDIKDLLFNIDAYKDLFSNVDMVCGGPPCQGFSMANRQPTIDDPRNVLYKYFLEFLDFVKPKFFIMENVKGMAKKSGYILGDFESVLKGKYDISYRILNARDFGVPQNRERFIVIGNRIGISSETVFVNICNGSHKPFSLKAAISDLPPLQASNVKNKTSIENDSIGYAKRKHIYDETAFYRYVNNGRRIDYLFNHKSRYNNERDIQIFSLLPQGENSLHDSIADIMPYQSRNHIFKDKYFKLKYDDVCKTITSHMKFDCNMYIHPTQARGLTPREAARIQTFPDDFEFTGPQNSWYMQIGNAVPVKLAEAIGKEIIKWL